MQKSEHKFNKKFCLLRIFLYLCDKIVRPEVVKVKGLTMGIYIVSCKDTRIH